MHFSKYNVNIETYSNKYIFNLLYGAVISLEKDKYDSFLKNDLSAFSKQEIESLLKMGFICDIDENSIIESKRKDFFENDSFYNVFYACILTTTKCNAHCYYCFEKGIKSSVLQKDVAIKIADYVIRESKGLPIQAKWFGGEPLLNPSAIDTICDIWRTNSIKFRSVIVTNGYLIDRSIDNMKDLWNVEEVQVSIDGINRDYNNVKKFNSQDAFNKIIRNIKILVENHIKVGIRINFSPLNLEQCIETIDYLHNLFGDNPYINIYCANIFDTEGIPSPLDFKAEDNPFLKIYSKLMDHGYVKTLKKIKFRPILFPCASYSKNSITIDCFGNLYKCQREINSVNNSYGNINGSLNEANINRFKILNYPYEECNNCICLPFCRGGCYYNRVNLRKEENCVAIRNCVCELLRLFAIKVLEKGEKP